MRQRRHPGQRLAFHPLQERAPRRRDEGEVLDHAGGVQGGHRITAAGHRHELAGAGPLRCVLRSFNGRPIKGLHLENAERAVPHQGGGFADRVEDLGQRLGPDIEDLLVGRNAAVRPAQRDGAGGAATTIASFTTNSSGGAALTAFVPTNCTPVAGTTEIAAGGVLTYALVDNATTTEVAVAVTVTVEWI